MNMDINKILTVKVSGVCPKSLSRLLILSQSCNVVNPGKMFHSNSVDFPLIIISVAFPGFDSCNSVFPSFVGIRMLKNPSEAQHRIREEKTFVL